MGTGSLVRVFVCVALLLALGVPAWGQAVFSADTHDKDKSRINGGTVGIVSSNLGGHDRQSAHDLAGALNEGDTLRIMPMLGRSAIHDITDILYLRGVDIGIVQTDVLEFVRRQGFHYDLDKRLGYIAKLYNRELHLIARKDVATIADLAGRKVNFGPEGSGSFVTATTVFASLNIAAEPGTDDHALALEKLKRGEIAGVALVAPKPSRLVASISADDDLHLIAVPWPANLHKAYVPAVLAHTDYGALVADSMQVDTIAAGTVMAAFNWSKDNDRHDNVERFVDAFFGNFDRLLKPPHHPKWREVNLKARLPGWRRLDVAKRWLARSARSAENELQGSVGWIANGKGGIRRMSSAERRRLIEQFLETQKRRDEANLKVR